MQPAARRNLVLALAAVLILAAYIPGVDLFVTGLFYSKTKWFFLRYEPAFEFIRKGLPVVIFGIATYLLLIWLAGEILKDRFFGLSRRIMLYLALSLAIGPGLIVNLLFKDNWGRARPTTIVEFGGKLTFTPPFVISDQCIDNCSFVSGHAALAFWLFALALLAPAPWRRAACLATLLFGYAVGFVRIVQGAHFYSDVVTAGLITMGTCWLLHRLILGKDVN
jgi:lipid A 4'-phosphatase